VVKNAWSYNLIPPYVFMVWYLVKYRDTFIFYYIIKHKTNIKSHGLISREEEKHGK